MSVRVLDANVLIAPWHVHERDFASARMRLTKI
jgi:hypothetical protein